MAGGKQRRPGFLLAILLQGKRERKTSQPPGPVRVELTAPDATLWTWGPAEAEDRVTGPALDFCLLVTQPQAPETI